ncbi:hypothetical protein L0B52_04625 [Suttonella sp. R2A3]|nr:hypothetical protein [Suttonella sp. R2A3]UJF23647.1 hypothetical protein L0B52_04625 [Suttonella sp. R2A3]
MKDIAIGLIGYGTVGQGVVEVLEENAAEIERRCGYRLSVVAVAKRSWQGTDTEHLPFTCLTDGMAVATDPKIDILIELAGGEHPAKEFIEAALDHGKHVITANKALIAKHGQALFARSREKRLGARLRSGCCWWYPDYQSAPRRDEWQRDQRSRGYHQRHRQFHSQRNV